MGVYVYICNILCASIPIPIVNWGITLKLQRILVNSDGGHGGRLPIELWTISEAKTASMYI